MQYSRTGSGLLIAEEAMDEAAVRRALKDYDRDLRLVPQASETLGTTLWKVYRDAGNDRPAELVGVWQSDQGEPYPLSMRILDMVKALDKNSRHRHVDEDERNRVAQQRVRDDTIAEQQEMAREYAARQKRDPMLHRSQSLRMMRDRQRNQGKKV